MKTTIPNESEIKRTWYLIDADGRPVGRLAVQITELLRGKTKKDYTPHVDMGDFVVVINAAKAKLTGSKEQKKVYKKYTGYQSGLKEVKASVMRARHPEYLVTHAVRDMLPRTHLSRTQFRRLKVYPAADHPHTAQQPQTIK